MKLNAKALIESPSGPIAKEGEGGLGVAKFRPADKDVSSSWLKLGGN